MEFYRITKHTMLFGALRRRYFMKTDLFLPDPVMSIFLYLPSHLSEFKKDFYIDLW